MACGLIMKAKITLTVKVGVESKKEIEHEMSVLEEIIGTKPEISCGECGHNVAVFECEFFEFYQRVKDRIMSKIKAYE